MILIDSINILNPLLSGYTNPITIYLKQEPTLES